MEIDLASFIVPAFFLFVVLEWWIVSRRKDTYFKFESSVSNISVGIAERMLDLMLSGIFIASFFYIYEHWRIFTIPTYWWIYVLLLPLTDLVWYWYHRMGHEVNILWAAHIVHHQSEEFNYTVAARITTIQSFIRHCFWCVLPLLGFQPEAVVVMLVVHGGYSFFTHTRAINKMGWLEYVLITPSHHRVHHASNEKYLNKNYGDLFVFWDKLFGTFQKEEEEPSYGLTHNLKSNSFIWQHFHYYAEIWGAARKTPGFWGKLAVVFGKPETMDQDVRPEMERQLLPEKSRLRLSAVLKRYVLIQVILSCLLLLGFSFGFVYLQLIEKIALFLLVLVTLINCGALLEQRKWIFYLESARLLIVLTYLSYTFDQWWMFVLLYPVLILATCSNSLERLYYRILYGKAIRY
ncbi:MAG: sterol desaturase family protein [Bacteroidota bacterium]